MGYVEDRRRELEQYLPPLTRRPDFKSFWEETLAQAKAVPLRPHRKEAGCPFPSAKLYDISYYGFDETPIHGWLMLPTFARQEKYACIVHYHGFTGSRGQPWDFAPWLMMGLAVLSVDCREQGGMTGNHAAYSGGMKGNVACKGILDRYEYYYRAVYMDCLKALDFAETCPELDASRLVIEGGSQGGAIGMAVCALDSRPYAAMLDVPSASNLEERVRGGYGSYASIRDFLKEYPDALEQAFETLSYFDTMNMAENIRCPILASVGLLDETCPARCYFASYNRIRAPKRIEIYPFNAHDGCRGVHMGKKLAFLRELGLCPAQ